MIAIVLLLAAVICAAVYFGLQFFGAADPFREDTREDDTIL
jgi:hypothetical protein